MFKLSETAQPISKIYADGLTLWIRALPRLFPTALIFALLSYVLAAHIMRPDPELTLHLHVKRMHSEWYLIVLNFLLPMFFIALMYRQLVAKTLTKENLLKSLSITLVKLPHLIMATILSFAIIILGTAMLVVPGVIFLVILQFYIPLIMVENATWLTGIRQACDLVWGNWWRTVAVIGIPGILYIVISHSFEKLLDHFVVHGYLENALIHDHIISTLLISLLLPAIVAIYFVQLHDLRLRGGGKETPVDEDIAYYSSFW